MLKALTGIIVFDDLGFYLPFVCIPKLSKREAVLNISMPFTITLFLAIWPLTKYLSNELFMWFIICTLTRV